MAEDNFNFDSEQGAYTEEESKLSPKLLKIIVFAITAIIGLILMFVVKSVVFNLRHRGDSKVLERIWQPGVVPPKPPYQNLKLSPLKLNLNDPTGTNPVFLQLEIALAYEKNNIKLQTELLDRKFEIRDQIITLLSTKTYEDINTPDKIQSLKREIKEEANKLLMNGEVENIYIIEFNAVPRS